MKTTKKLYLNKYNSNKTVEVHFDNYGHFSIRQIMVFDDVKTFLGDGFLHRVRKSLLNEILNDYVLYFEYID